MPGTSSSVRTSFRLLDLRRVSWAEKWKQEASCKSLPLLEMQFDPLEQLEGNRMSVNHVCWQLQRVPDEPGSGSLFAFHPTREFSVQTSCTPSSVKISAV